MAFFSVDLKGLWQSWVRSSNVPLVLDLDKGCLSGVALGDPFQRLEFLGRDYEVNSLEVSHCNEISGTCELLGQSYGFVYKQFGLEVETDESNAVCGYQIEMTRNLFQGELAYGGKLIMDEVFRAASDFRSRDALNGLLGPPDMTTEDEPKTWFVQVHVRGDHAIVSQFDRNKRTMNLVIERRKYVLPNPTKSWVQSPHLELTANWDDISLCGVRLGESFQLLSKLGPASDCRFSQPNRGDFRYLRNSAGTRSLCFAKHSIHIDYDDDQRLVYIEFSLSRDACGVRLPWRGRLFRNGSEVPSLENRSEESVIAVLGSPNSVRQSRRPDGKILAKILVYEGADMDRVVTLDQNGVALYCAFAAKVLTK